MVDANMDEYDVIVVGGGPSGLTAAIRCRNHHLSVLLVEGRKLGGQLNQLYPTKYILDYSSYPEIRAGYLADLMIHHAKYKDVPMAEKTIVTSIKRSGKYFMVSTSKGEFRTKAVILAIGMGLFEPMKLGIPGEDRLEDRGVLPYNPGPLDPQTFPFPSVVRILPTFRRRSGGPLF